ncbi:hypothetical protein HC251_01205 [Iamia sp. SCSIO 61187]|uniref:winged helix-turn-helix domain-containing protein n=1 Tax=Iamia sp. SCSIO 61187 TaxID=2722752 RepID=UPI001C62AA6B|nr:winged helix-turn-helix domain-containing protein [Iamia sp. SCSIO 61187]QYG91188.1 hypothetical protein HC251_01205 [Iamia sp. SCSIO 61187]
MDPVASGAPDDLGALDGPGALDGRGRADDRGVEMLTWPAQEELRVELRSRGVPRLLVLEAGAAPPRAEDDLEDWIWLPADERDVFARLRHLAGRQRRGGLGPDTVTVASDGTTWIAGHRLRLPPAEAAILRCLADPPERLCRRADLDRAVWGEAPHARRSLDSRIFVLRRRIAPYGLVVHAVRGRGFVLTTPGPHTRGESW